VVKSPNGSPVQSPYIAIANRQAEIMLRITERFQKMFSVPPGETKGA
jgi:hypothetical protein